MKKKKPIDIKRDSGGMADIGSSEDGAILEMTKIGKRLIIVKEKAIYELMMADNVDPKRTNIDLPTNIQKLIIDKGADSEMVSKVFLTAKTLFKKELFDADIDLEKALTLSLNILQEMRQLENEINDYLNKEESLIQEYNSNKELKKSYAIPAFGNIETRCKTIFQKADHIEQILMEVITIFYPNENLTKQSHFPKLYEVIKNKYGEEDSFTKYLSSILDFMKLVRALRNALDHRLDVVKTFDFELQSNSDVITPTIELKKYRGSELKRQSLFELFKIILPNLIFVFENTITFISSKTFKPNPFAQGVKEIPVDKRRYKNVRYSFWSNIGKGGYYNQ